MKKLWCKIEQLRNEMHRVALEKGISHPDVLIISQMLDQVMNELDKKVLVNKQSMIPNR